MSSPALRRFVTSQPHHNSSLDDAPPPGARPPRALPRLRMPAPGDRRTGSAILSLGLHALLVALFVVPITFADDEPIVPIEQGAGGEGPAGGGGGGTRGTGGDSERIQYVAVSPPPPQQVAAPVPAPLVPPPEPAVVPPEPQPVATPQIPPANVQAIPSDRNTTIAPLPGVGGGTGNDGTAGSGPGSGGGVGSGIGTGRGSGIGPGTGGGSQANYPPSPTEMFLPPLPTPANVKGFRLIAEFDVDSTGRVLSFKFTETRNGGYNRQLREVLRSIRFRPGTRPDGTPVRMKAQIEYIF